MTFSSEKMVLQLNNLKFILLIILTHMKASKSNFLSGVECPYTRAHRAIIYPCYDRAMIRHKKMREKIYLEQSNNGHWLPLRS